MSDPRRCHVCGAVLMEGRLAGLCPACTWKGLVDIEEDEEGLAPDSIGTPKAKPGLLMRVAGYEVLGEIARGGMGIVYRARQLEPPRTVALKMLLPHQLGSLEMAERFRM